VRCAILLTWYHARAIEHPIPEEIVELVTKLIPAAKVEAGLDPDEVDALEHSLTSLIADVAQRLADAGEDPFSPLPTSPEEP
jgi:hypothetical protein